MSFGNLQDKLFASLYSPIEIGKAIFILIISIIGSNPITILFLFLYVIDNKIIIVYVILLWTVLFFVFSTAHFLFWHASVCFLVIPSQKQIRMR
jgi:hypothetical protein